MSSVIDSVNSGLRKLDEAHRLGQITREAYLGRRRQLLASLVDGGGTTIPRAAPSVAGGAPVGKGGEPAGEASGSARRRGMASIVAVAVLVAAAAGFGAWMYRAPADPERAPTAALSPPAPPPSVLSAGDAQQASELDSLANVVANGGHWTADALTGFLHAWNAAGPAARQHARELPGVALLSEQIGSKRRVADLLVDGDSSGQMSAQDAQALHAVDDALRAGP